jgi:hypothetical protein
MNYDLNKIKIGMVVCFVNDGSFIGDRIVKYQEWLGFTGIPASMTHCSVSMGGPYLVDATFPKSKVSNINEDYQGRKAYFYYLNNMTFRETCRYKFTLWAATKLNLDYGWLSLFGFYLNSILPIFGDNPLHSKRTPFCSYLVGWAIRRAGFDPWPGVPTGLLTPAHVAASREFEVVDVSI